MAVYWIDPYIHASIGGIHGTTSSGSGTYASPYSLADMHYFTSSGSYVGGDEFRIKGLAESTFFPTQKDFTSVSSAGSYDNYYYIDNADTHKLFRIKDQDNDQYMYTPSSQTPLRTTPGSSTWYTAYGQLDETHGYYLLDDQYAISTSSLFSDISTTNYYFFNLTNDIDITITSGWTSETVRDGVSVIFFDYSQTSRWYTYWGGSSINGTYLTWDCPELIIANSYSKYMSFYGRDIDVKSISMDNYSPGHPMNIGARGSSIKLSSVACGGYIYLYCYNYGNTTFTLDVDMICGAYQNYTYIYDYTNGTVTEGDPEFEIKFKEFYANRQMYMYNQSGNAYDIKLTLKDGWAFETLSANESFFIENDDWTIIENLGTGKSPTYFSTASNVETNLFSYLTPPSSNRSITNTDGNLESDSASLLKVARGSNTIYRSFGKTYTHSQTLETVDFCPVFNTSSSSYGSPQKINMMRDSVSNKPCQFIFPSSGGASLLAFNSSAYNDALTWHFYPECNGYTYADTFYLGTINPSLDNIFQYTLTTSTSPGLSINVYLYLVNDQGIPQSYGSIIPSVDGNTYTVSTTLDSSFISSNNSKSAFVVLDVTKTNTTVANLAINTLRLVKQ